MPQISQINFYANKKQLEFMSKLNRSVNVFIGGRGTGKSTCIALATHCRLLTLPRAKFMLLGVNVKKLKTKTCPPFFKALQALGYRECKDGVNGHYMKWRKPPDFWESPWEAPEDYENVITFSNGYTIELLGWNLADSDRGGNYDGADVDEAGGLDQSVWDQVFLPSIRANQTKSMYKGNPYHLQKCFYSSMPWLPSGKWILKYEKLAKDHPEEVGFTRCTSWDNLHILGKKTIMQWKRDMLPLVYQVEIMSENIDEVPNAFYPEFKEHLHCYLPPLDQPYNDIHPDEPLYISFDFNAGFICCVVAQVNDEEIRIIRELYVKGNKQIEHLIELIDKEFHELVSTRIIYVLGDRGGNNRNVQNQTTVFEDIVNHFDTAGWEATIEAPDNYTGHQLKYQIINKSFMENKESMKRIRINKRGCTNLCIAIRQTPVKTNFQKDKSSESSEAVEPEHATHLPDAFDYLIIPLNSDAYTQSEGVGGTAANFF